MFISYLDNDAKGPFIVYCLGVDFDLLLSKRFHQNMCAPLTTNKVTNKLQTSSLALLGN